MEIPPTPHSFLHINDNIIRYLMSTSQWTKLLAILGFISCGFMVLAGLFLAVLGSVIPSFGFDSIGPSIFGLMPWMFALFYLALALLYFFPSLYLYNFSNKIQHAFRTTDQALLEEAFLNLKSSFKFLGMSILILIGLYVVAIITLIATNALFLSNEFEV